MTIARTDVTGIERPSANDAGTADGTAAPPSSFEIYRQGGTTDAITLTVRLVLAARRWRALLDEHLRQIGQSTARLEAMAAILNSATPSAQVDIARRLRIEGPTMTRMLDTLEKDGLVQRLPDPNDRRSKQLRVTPAGEKALEEIFAISDVLRARLLADVSGDRIDEANGFLMMLIERLDAGLPEDTGPERGGGA